VDAQVKSTVEECSRASAEGRMTFPTVVMKLMAAGVEQYHADFRRTETTYYMPDGASHVVASPLRHVAPAQAFSAAGVEAAIRTVQAGSIDYREFCERVIAAGCVGYFVCIAGRRAVYFGRTGESFVEPFPNVA
jgi:uncharacterized protein YbcV (DUF1398 family)